MKKGNRLLGMDVGSVTTKLVLTSQDFDIVFEDYIRNEGGPIWAIQQAFRNLKKAGFTDSVGACGVTGSGRELASVILNRASCLPNRTTSCPRKLFPAEPSISAISH